MDNKKNNFDKIVAEIGPGDSLGVGLMSLILRAKKYYAFDTVEFANIEQNLKIFNGLISLIKNKTNVPDNIEFPRMQPKLRINFLKFIY